MASYRYIGGSDEIQILSEDISRPGQRVAAQAVPSGVVYSLLFAPWPTDPTGKVIWTPEAIDSQLESWGAKWNTNFAVPGVVGISVTQALNLAGELKDVAIVTVISSSGNTTTTFNLFDTLLWEPAAFAEQVASYQETLDAIEAGGA